VTSDVESVPELVRARGLRLGAPFHFSASTISTNDDAKAGARAGAPHGSVWLADTQTAGRGRQGRRWESPPGENLLFSVLLRIPCAPARVPPLSLVVGLAARDAVARALGDDAAVKVKWPNDVHARGRKVAGILVESSVAGARVESLVVGIGINVHTRAFPPELAPIATSVALEGGAADRAAILVDVLAGLDRDLERAAHVGLGALHARLTAHDALAGRRAAADGIEGVASGIDAEGRLLLRRDDGTLHRIVSGEVHLRLA
jgi:BirA family biotin operon repressor/biotin-[acetyl-CoA-carboxylase] ligase